MALLGILLFSTGITPGFGQTRSAPSNDSLQAQNLYEQGRKLFNEADYDSSLALLSKAADYYERVDNFSVLAECYTLISTNHRVLNNLEESERMSLEVLELLKKRSLQLPRQQLKALNNLGLVETERSNFTAAISFFNDALKLTEKPGIPDHMRAMIMGNLGSLYDDRGDFEKALDHYEEGIGLLSIDESEQHRKQLAKLYNYTGVTQVKMGRFEEALQFYKRELELNLDLYGTSHPSVAGGYNNIGGIYYRRGDIGEAIVYFKRAASSTQLTFGKYHPRVGLIYNNIGACYYEIGDYSQSIEYLKKSAEIKKATQGAEHPDLALTYNNIGSIYTEMEQYDEAIDFLNRSLEIREKVLGENHPVLSNNHNSLGLLYLNTGKPDEAITHFSKGLTITETARGPGHPYAAEARTNLAKAYREKGNYTSALKHLDVAEHNLSRKNENHTGKAEVGWGRQFRYPTYAIDVLYQKGKTLHEKYKHNPKEGPASLTTALDVYLQLSRLMDEMQITFRNEESKLLMSSRSHEMYESAIEVSFDLYRETDEEYYLQQLFYFSEKSKSRVILELLNNKRAKQYAGVPDSLITREQTLREELSGIQQLMSSRLRDPDSNTVSDSLEVAYFNKHRHLNEHIEMLKRDYPRYHALKYDSEVPGVSDIQELLKAQSLTLLEYFYGTESTWAIIIGGDTIEAVPLSHVSDLTAKVRNFDRAVSQKEDSLYISMASELYNKLVEPVESRIHTENLLIIPDGPLNLLPFEALLIKEPENRGGYSDFSYLLDRYAVSYLASASISAFFKEEAEQESYPNKLAAFAPVFSGPGISELPSVASRNSWDALPSTKYEVQQIAEVMKRERGLWSRLTGEDPNRLFLADEATESRFKKSMLQQYRYLHLATHAFASDSAEGRAGIAFHPETEAGTGDDGILYAEEIYGLDLDNELVVLSACETGTGEIRTGEGIIGLSRAFQYAGAENLMVSLWSVEDRSTARLMISFYEGIQKGQNPAIALQSAKQELADSSNFAHPRYWSPFIFIGN
ncbi:MAG: tetratricopeptide repeat protein [Balneolaceae bacterium]|nr:tetratricopeptide repeat protein [Balneolaceae bacterium]